MGPFGVPMDAPSIPMGTRATQWGSPSGEGYRDPRGTTWGPMGGATRPARPRNLNFVNLADAIIQFGEYGGRLHTFGRIWRTREINLVSLADVTIQFGEFGGR